MARLEEAGLVDRRACEQDRRVARVRVTTAGRQLLQRSRTRKDAYLARRLQILEPADRALMGEAVAVLEQLLESGEW